jgi:alanyl-tRNA synthetase
MSAPYPELRAAASTVAQVTEVEEERFIATLDQGLPILNDLVAKARAVGRSSLSGADVFKLYDTYGFPLDLITEACREQGMMLDESGFQTALEEQRERARRTAGFEMTATKPIVKDVAARLGATRFVGYDSMSTTGRVQALLKGDRLVVEAVEGDEVEVALDVTPFYAVGGGQVGDRGVLIGSQGRIEVQETTRPSPELVLHKGVVRAGHVREGESLQAEVDVDQRLGAARHHTATHLVHAALREVLGSHVRQLGSLVAPNRLRFDFSHFRPLSSRDLDDIQTLVNERVVRNDQVQTNVMGIDEAVAGGALAFFGDKYGDRVRVVSIESFSKELCGGTHCRHTGEIGMFRIAGETGVAAGVRRIEAVTAGEALAQVKRLEQDVQELSELLKVAPSEVVGRTRKLVLQLKERERELEQIKLRLASGGGADSHVRMIKGIQVHAQKVEGMDQAGLRTLVDNLRDKLRSGVIALGSVVDGKVSLLVTVSKDLVPGLKAGDLIKDMAAEVGGTGGGRPEMAQAGGKNPERLDAALEKIFALVEMTAAR